MKNMITINNNGMKTTEMLTRNIAKSGEVLNNWNGFTPFKSHLGLIVNRLQPASCHVVIR